LLYLVVLPLIFVLIVAALKLDEALRPPLWLLLGLITLVVPGSIIGALRLAKATLLIARLRAAGALA
jgi:tellurite resistance protein TehA-like permease